MTNVTLKVKQHKNLVSIERESNTKSTNNYEWDTSNLDVINQRIIIENEIRNLKIIKEIIMIRWAFT